MLQETRRYVIHQIPNVDKSTLTPNQKVFPSLRSFTKASLEEVISEKYKMERENPDCSCELLEEITLYSKVLIDDVITFKKAIDSISVVLPHLSAETIDGISKDLMKLN